MLLILAIKSYTYADSTRVCAMPGKQAKILSGDNIEDLLLYAAQTPLPAAQSRDRAAVCEGRPARRRDSQAHLADGDRARWRARHSHRAAQSRGQERQ